MDSVRPAPAENSKREPLGQNEAKTCGPFTSTRPIDFAHENANAASTVQSPLQLRSTGVMSHATKPSETPPIPATPALPPLDAAVPPLPEAPAEPDRPADEAPPGLPPDPVEPAYGAKERLSCESDLPLHAMAAQEKSAIARERRRLSAPVTEVP
jgi:hypothetical protein